MEQVGAERKLRRPSGDADPPGDDEVARGGAEHVPPPALAGRPQAHAPVQAQVCVQAAAVGRVHEEVLPPRLNARDDRAGQRPAVDPGADERPQAARGSFQRVSLGHPGRR